MLATMTAAGCGASSGASLPSTPEEVEELSDQFNHDLYDCLVDLGVPAKIVGDGISLLPGATGGGHEVEDCTDRLLQESRYAFFNNAP
jgi:hypothetical protein